MQPSVTRERLFTGGGGPDCGQTASAYRPRGSRHRAPGSQTVPEQPGSSEPAPASDNDGTQDSEDFADDDEEVNAIQTSRSFDHHIANLDFSLAPANHRKVCDFSLSVVSLNVHAPFNSC